ncbi:putative nucleosome assembly protein [Neospora caninum Liverpool]|uniref:Nucleosome assembly protein, putative n=1 Tax=Neospora caninum (strain Liverpool) TaxID=572307 RepID=F0VHC1_NEOCL|nr:putative nucleosome assembly protein [Neospora caninum Liverpool]CBZ53115.1 putative nucleosome assembly protein [Neospora caninum Liverpool]CEL67101.1 TPA: nucleosome assembly protein, putative [Neospora caninum Liverpool]|eukprot:XP_003883147.1 putative nucleosome assembly protein [Neospora caninum Liverpool]
MAPREKKSERSKQPRRKGSGEVVADGGKLLHANAVDVDVFGSPGESPQRSPSDTTKDKGGEERAASWVETDAFGDAEAVAKPRRIGVTLAKTEGANDEGNKEEGAMKEKEEEHKKEDDATKEKEEEEQKKDVDTKANDKQGDVDTKANDKKGDDAIKEKEEEQKKDVDMKAHDEGNKKGDVDMKAKEEEHKKEDDATKEKEEEEQKKDVDMKAKEEEHKKEDDATKEKEEEEQKKDVDTKANDKQGDVDTKANDKKGDDAIKEKEEEQKKDVEMKAHDEGNKKGDVDMKAKEEEHKKEDDATKEKEEEEQKKDVDMKANDEGNKKGDVDMKAKEEEHKKGDVDMTRKEVREKTLGERTETSLTRETDGPAKDVETAASEAERAEGEAARQIQAAEVASEEAREAEQALAKSISRAQELQSELRAAPEDKSKEEVSERVKEARDALKAAKNEAEQKAVGDVKAIEAAESAAATAAKAELEDELAKSNGASPADEAPTFQIRVSPASSPEGAGEKAPVSEALLKAMAAVGLDASQTRDYLKAVEEEAASAAAEGKDSRYEGLASSHKVVARLEGNQEQVRLMESRFQEEVAVLREKFDRLMEPIFEERAAILSACPEEETPGSAGDSSRNDSLPVGTRALPGFWLRAFENNRLLSSMLGGSDKPLLLYLRNIRRVLNKDKEDGFSLVFEFGENPFFTPCTLTKTFKMKQDEDGYIVSKTVGTPIMWNENMDVTKSVVVRKQRNVRTKGVRTIHEEKQEKSFFLFFNDSVVPEDDELDAMSEAEQSAILDKLKLEYDAGVTLRDLIIPYAMDWYLGTAVDTLGYDDDEPETVQNTEVDNDSGRRKEDVRQEEDGGIASWFGF